jgi:hypothetical protein
MNHCNIIAYRNNDLNYQNHVMGGYSYHRIKAIDQVTADGKWTVIFKVDPEPYRLDLEDRKLQTDYETIIMRVYSGGQEHDTIWNVRVDR